MSGNSIGDYTRTLVNAPGLYPLANCRRLAALAADVPSDAVIVELGVFKGRSLAWLAHGANAGSRAQVFGVDPWGVDHGTYDSHAGRARRFIADSNKAQAKRLFQRLGLSATLIQGRSVDVAAEWVGTVGLLHVDGDHSAEAVVADFTAWAPHLADDAVVVFDDYAPTHPGVVTGVDHLLQMQHVRKVEQLGRMVITTRSNSGNSGYHADHEGEADRAV